MAKIKSILAREILDSRGNPTVEVEMMLDSGSTVIASVPSGASVGSKETLELRDNDKKRYHGKGVLKAVNNVNNIIAPKIIGMDLNQYNLDKYLIELDGTDKKSNLGANAILAVSLANLKAEAAFHNTELFSFVSIGEEHKMPVAMFNIINGGAHANNRLTFQEFMIIPLVKGFKERLRIASEIFHELENILKKSKISIGVGDEGGFAPPLPNNKVAIALMIKAIEASGYKPGEDVYIALDSAASEFYIKEENKYLVDDEKLSGDELIAYYKELIEKYPILSIEDPFDENDWEHYTKFTAEFGNQIMIVGDDLFVTNSLLLNKGISEKACNAIIIKANQISTVTEMVETIVLAKKHNYKTIISHRSGETEDTFIADLAVGLNIPYIKTGSVCRGERIAKYNRLLRIEEKL